LNKQALFHLSIFTLFGFSLIGYIVMHFHPSILFWSFFEDENPFASIAIGLAGGLAVGALGLAILKIGKFDSTNRLFTQMIKELNPQWYHIVFYSFCAGVGEEILFRGAMQSYIHIWPTAIIFVLIHGYINPKDLKMSIYGLFLVLISAGFGYLMKYQSMYAAMSAHFMYDVVMFAFLKYKADKLVEDF
jgi:uncharacterized protein